MLQMQKNRKKAKKKAVSEVKKREGASSAGWHFITEFRLCRYKFLLSKIMGLCPSYLGKQLIFGTAFHAAKAQFYSSGKEDDGIDAGLQSLRSQAPLYFLQDDYKYDQIKLQKLMKGWVDTFGIHDLEINDVVEVEKEHIIQLPYGVSMTARLDVVLRNKDDGALKVGETKTTGYRIESAIDGVSLGGQSRTYSLAIKQDYPGEKFHGIQPDVAYWPKGAKNTEPQFVRGSFVVIGPEQLKTFSEECSGTIREITARVQNLKEDNQSSLFQRTLSPEICTAYMTRCPYFDICLAGVKPGDDVFGLYWDDEVVARFEKLMEDNKNGRC